MSQLPVVVLPNQVIVTAGRYSGKARRTCNMTLREMARYAGRNRLNCSGFPEALRAKLPIRTSGGKSMALGATMSDYVVKVLQDAGISLASTVIVIGLILLGVLVPLVAALYVFKKRLERHGVKISMKWNAADMAPGRLEDMTSSNIAGSHERTMPEQLANDFSLRRLLKAVYKILTLLISISLFAGAFFAWRAATPANQLLLVSGILFVLGLMVLLSAGKLDRQDRDAENWHDIGRQLSSLAKIDLTVAEPDVHRIGLDTIAQACRMKEEGCSLPQICEMIEAGYSGWDRAHQAAFEKVVDAMLEAERG